MTSLEIIASARRRIELSREQQAALRRHARESGREARTLPQEIDHAIRSRLEKLEEARELRELGIKRRVRVLHPNPSAVPGEARAICSDLIAAIHGGKGFAEACKEANAPKSSVMYWRRLDRQLDAQFKAAIAENGRPNMYASKATASHRAV